MSRKDGWSDYEDQLLANTVLTYIEQGKTQLEAFDDVSVALNRTAAGVGFRWNGFIRKQYEDEIKEAKTKKLASGSRKNNLSETPIANNKLIQNVDEVIAVLLRLRNEYKSLSEQLSEAYLRREELDLELQKQKANPPIVAPYNSKTEDAEALRMIIQKANELLSKNNKKPAI